MPDWTARSTSPCIRPKRGDTATSSWRAVPRSVGRRRMTERAPRRAKRSTASVVYGTVGRVREQTISTSRPAETAHWMALTVRFQAPFCPTSQS